VGDAVGGESVDVGDGGEMARSIVGERSVSTPLEVVAARYVENVSKLKRNRNRNNSLTSLFL
jgi:hypothetical protein